MSGIGDIVYRLLLGWMRAIVDWVWSLIAGTGSVGVWQWFLSNWKVWLIILLVGGLALDWIIWMVRWRPYRLLLGRFRRATPDGEAAADWDSGEGYYAPEVAADLDPEDEGQWTETNFATLSEIDPDWAGDVVIGGDEDMLYDPNYDPAHNTMEGYYAEQYEEPIRAEMTQTTQDTGYWDEMPDEQPEMVEMAMPPIAPPSGPILGATEEIQEDMPPPGFDPFAPYDAYAPQEAAAHTEQEAPAKAADDDMPQQYGRPGLWPGMTYPMAAAKPDIPAREDDYDPLFNPDAPQSGEGRRRRRRVREASPEEWTPNDPIVEEDTGSAPMPTWVDVPGPGAVDAYDLGYPEPGERPERVVKPASLVPDRPPDARGTDRKGRQKGVRTVTGKPAARRGLFRLSAASDEPILGLPPMEVDDPFAPAAMPENPDFAADEGDEYA